MLPIWAATSVLAAAPDRDVKGVIADSLFSDIGIFAAIEKEDGNETN
jgi:hypothetical protein